MRDNSTVAIVGSGSDRRRMGGASGVQSRGGMVVVVGIDVEVDDGSGSGELTALELDPVDDLDTGAAWRVEVVCPTRGASEQETASNTAEVRTTSERFMTDTSF